MALVAADFGHGWGEPPYEAGAPGSLHEPVREVFRLLGLDAGRQGTAAWNPISDLVRPGGRVVIKPNLVRHCHDRGGDLACVVTDPRLTRAVLDAAVAAVGPAGEVLVADSPLQSCDLSALRRALGLDALLAAGAAGGTRVRLLDFRREWVVKGPAGLIVQRTPLSGDPEGYRAVDLAERSRLASLPPGARRFRVTQYDRELTVRHHETGRHEYLIPRSLLDADLVISLPKIKTHRKAGLTGALKNLVGINGSKAWLPHHRSGSVAEGGDEYLHRSWRKRVLTRLWERMDRTPSLASRRVLDRMQDWVRATGRVVPFPDPYFEGSWHGNRTLPAMVADLNRILLYARPDGSLASEPVRRLLVVADAVLAGEGEGPLEPDPVELGRLIGGFNAAAVDWTAATLMGFDPRRIGTLSEAFAPGDLPLAAFEPEAIRIRQSAAGEPWTAAQLAAVIPRPCVPAAGWRGHIEAEGRGGDIRRARAC